jgi:hypothetical protein
MTTMTPTATMEYEAATDKWSPAGWHVKTEWTTNPPVDRPRTHGFLIRNQKVAERLVAAINAGAVYVDAEIKMDIHDQTYVAARSLVMAKYANADLRKIGY